MGNEQVEKLVDCAVRGAAIGGGELGSVLCFVMRLTLRPLAAACLIVHLTI
jgi:hypothetical protein